MEVWTHEVDGYRVTSYTNPTQQVLDALRTNTINRPYLNRFEGGTLDIPERVLVPGDEDNMAVMETIPRTEWVDIQKAAQDARDAIRKAERIAARKAARQLAAQALRDAKVGNFLAIDPVTDRIFIDAVARTTVTQLASGGLTSEGEPA